MVIRPFLRMLAAAVLLINAGCKILPTATDSVKAGEAEKAFDPNRMVADIWASKVVPYLNDRAGAFQDVSALAANDPEGAGARFGNPKKQPNSPWTYVAIVEGTVVASNTKSRAATVDVDADGDGKADIRVQIGPAIRGTALRDVLDFVDFNSFKNQIDFAQFGKSFNTYANETVLSLLPRDDLEGKRIRLLGAYVPGTGGELPLMTPAEAEIGPVQ